MPGNSIGCLPVHGLVDSPKEMCWMVKRLDRQGYTVLGVRRAGHATRIKDVERTRWWDWDGLGSQDKQMPWVENSGHLIPQDAGRQQAIQAIMNFIERVTEAQA